MQTFEFFFLRTTVLKETRLGGNTLLQKFLSQFLELVNADKRGHIIFHSH